MFANPKLFLGLRKIWIIRSSCSVTLVFGRFILHFATAFNMIEFRSVFGNLSIFWKRSSDAWKCWRDQTEHHRSVGIARKIENFPISLCIGRYGFLRFPLETVFLTNCCSDCIPFRLIHSFCLQDPRKPAKRSFVSCTFASQRKHVFNRRLQFFPSGTNSQSVQGLLLAYQTREIAAVNPYHSNWKIDVVNCVFAKCFSRISHVQFRPSSPKLTAPWPERPRKSSDCLLRFF